MPGSLFFFTVAYYIGFRYTDYIGSRYSWGTVESIALTEAVFYILLSLDEPLHGYGIMQNAERLSNGRVRLAAGTLYGALDTLQKRRWIEPAPGAGSGRKKEYRLTDAGRDAVRVELDRLRELVGNGEEIVGRWSA